MSHRLRDDVGQRLVGQRRFDSAVGRAAYHEGVGAGPAGADVGQAVAVLVARAAVARVVEHRDVAQRRVDKKLLCGKIKGGARRHLRREAEGRCDDRGIVDEIPKRRLIGGEGV